VLLRSGNRAWSRKKGNSQYGLIVVKKRISAGLPEKAFFFENFVDFYCTKQL
jgi:hypothetical protein